MIYNVDQLSKEIGIPSLNIYQTLEQLGIPLPGWEGWDQETYFEIKSIFLQFQIDPYIMVGADPEFEVVSSIDGSFHAAHNFLRGGTTHQLGVDGNSRIGEIRPSPGSPEKVLYNIRKLLIKARQQIPLPYEIQAGSGKYQSIGGHIHFSGKHYSDTLIDVLERFISRPLNSKSNNQRRRSEGYGSPRSVREQPHGWEYRTPCSWIAHPVIALGVLTIAWGLTCQPDSVLRNLRTRDQLYAVLGYRALFARKFYDVLDSIQEIESIKVFRAWAIEKEVSETVLSVPAVIEEVNIRETTIDNISVSDDLFMDVIQSMRLSALAPIRIFGMGAERNRRFRSRWGTDRVISIPRSWSSFVLIHIPRNLKILINEDQRQQNDIGLSHGLRLALSRSSRVGRGRSLYRTTYRILQELINYNVRVGA